MPIQPSGTIALSDIQTEFGGSNPISLSEYYRGGLYVTSNNTSVPTSGTISLSNFYGAVKQFSFTVSSNQQEMDLSTYATSVGWDGSAAIVMTISSGVYLWSDSVSVGGLTIPSSLNGLVTIVNNGYIIGRGGNGGGYDGSPQNGGPALVNNATGVTLTNASGAYIAGGGGGGSGGAGYGGGGGGAGGGNGGRGRHVNGTIYSGGTGGAVGQSGTAAPQDVYSGGNGGRGQGGGTGGGGGSGSNWFEGLRVNGGGGGGRILNGSGGAGGTSDSAGPIGTGGTGGSLGNAGGDGTGVYVGDGGGGWGAAGGGSGGSGGAAISGTAIATYTNNGTVYGSTA